jgi:erythromycin esterase-like protein
MACKLSTDDFWMQVVNNLINANINHGVRDIDVIRSFNARDSQMAQNLNWLRLVKFPGKKMIVWAANTHVGKQADTLMKNKSGQSFTSMGSFFTRDSLMLNQTYVLGFTSFNGKAGRLTSNEYTIPTPSPNTFESWIDTSFQYAFIDFRTFNKQYPNADNPFYLKGFLHYPEKENWTKVFDGIFYIKDMYPCNR